MYMHVYTHAVQHVQYMLLFLVLAVNSDWFQVLKSYRLLPKPPVLMRFCTFPQTQFKFSGWICGKHQLCENLFPSICTSFLPPLPPPLLPSPPPPLSPPPPQTVHSETSSFGKPWNRTINIRRDDNMCIRSPIKTSTVCKSSWCFHSQNTVVLFWLKRDCLSDEKWFLMVKTGHVMVWLV